MRSPPPSRPYRRTTGAPAGMRWTASGSPSSCREMAPRERALGKSTPRPAWFASPPGGEEPSPLGAGLRTVAVVAGRHRRVLAAMCAGAAVVVAVSALTPPSAASSPADGGSVAGSALLPASAGDQPAGNADRVAVTVRLADPAGLLLVRAGSHAEVLAGPAADAGGAGGARGRGPPHRGRAPRPRAARCSQRTPSSWRSRTRREPPRRPHREP